MQILVIDDDHALCRTLQIHLERANHTVAVAFSAREGIEALESKPIEVVFIDLQLPDFSGLDVLRRLEEIESEPFAVMITGTQDTRATIEAVRLGAFDYLRKPLDLDAVLVTIEKAAERLRKPVSKQVTTVASVEDGPHEIVGANPKIIEVLKQVALCSKNRFPVLIEGESGTGKEMVARVLHETSTPGRPFVGINCAAIVATLLESELFGHDKGSFTGADATKIGKLEVAADGTIFFDEIGDMSPDLQAKLLRTLQECEFERVGGTASLPLEARVLAATHRDLRALVAEGRFREDLFYRLAVTTIHLPPLRERRSDVPLLARHLLAQVTKDLDKTVEAIEDSALRQLQTHDWPGNVRELRNVIMRACVLARTEVITKDDIVSSMEGGVPRSVEAPAEIPTLREVEKRHIEVALHHTGWNVSRTAGLLGISRVTLRKKIKDYQIAPEYPVEANRNRKS